MNKSNTLNESKTMWIDIFPLTFIHIIFDYFLLWVLCYIRTKKQEVEKGMITTENNTKFFGIRAKEGNNLLLVKLKLCTSRITWCESNSTAHWAQWEIGSHK